MGSVVTMRSARWATLLIAACIVVPQLLVAALSPWIGRRAQIWGRRPLLLIGFAALPIRGILFASVTNPELLVVVQLLDGITAAVLSVMVPLVVADLTRGTGHFNLGQGIVGTFVGIGASLSATHRRLDERPSRQHVGLCRIGGDRVGRTGGALVPDAGNPRCSQQPLSSYKAGASSVTSRRCGATAVGQAAIDRQIILRHASRGEALLEPLADFLPRQMAKPIDRADGAVDVLDDEAGEAVVDHFREPSRD